MESLTAKQRRTVDVVETVNKIDVYTCMNVLYKLSDGEDAPFKCLIAKLEAWRDALRHHHNR